MAANIWSVDNNQQLEATTEFRKRLSIGNCWFYLMFLMHYHYHYVALILDVCCVEDKPPIDEVIQSGVVPRFVQFLDKEDFPQLQVSNLSFYF